MFTFLLAAGLFIQSCGQKGEMPAPEEGKLTVSPTSVVLDPQGGQDFIHVTSPEDWLLRTDAKWLKIVTSSGSATSEPVKATFTFDANTDGAARNAVLTVKTLKGKTAEVKVQQDKFEGELAERGIATADDLKAFALAVNSGSALSPFMKNGVVVLLNDIDASSIKEWIPAGTRENPFTGNFDGRGHVISNINWTVDASAYQDCGLIGYAKGANVSNVFIGEDGDCITIKGNASSINAGAVVGYADGGEISGCTVKADLVYEGTSSGKDICIAGLCGRLTSGGEGAYSNYSRGDVTSPTVCRAAGFVAHNEGTVKNCYNYGTIRAEKSGDVGPAWGCSYNKVPENFVDNTGRGHVGEDADAYLNAVASPAKEGYDLEKVSVDMTQESYYDWTEVESMQLSNGVKYTHYDCDNVPRKVHILEIDLTSPEVDITACYANDCVPNPNGNKNSNNGFKIRETLSQLCTRKRTEGHDVIAGINTGFFDSNDGISRGFHIEEGQPVYINNPAVVSNLGNHAWAFTVFTDRTASCGKKKFTGKIKTADQEFSWCSMNDTIMRNVSPSYQINLYNSRYKKTPHASNTSLVNKLAKNALYVIAEYVDAPMTVNTGYAAAKVISIHDGRFSALSEGPYITSDKQVGISLSGAEADKFMTLISVGSTVEFCCDMTIEGETTRPIYAQCSTMYHIHRFFCIASYNS